MDGLDAFTQQAIGILTSSALAEALDLSKENPKLVEKYGKGDPNRRADGAPKMTENFLIARRLVEAGARVVSLNFSRWDWHGGNFNRGRQDMPMLDRATASLVEDLHDRGMDKDVLLVVTGEMGRTPKINNKKGRDHWARICSLALASMTNAVPRHAAHDFDAGASTRRPPLSMAPSNRKRKSAWSVGTPSPSASTP